ncbi:uncharacterized protein LOC106011962 [Aplysia californica]|uniref:Uncharacterized protein LOC106011962 n=1 Tax=Aplysia californica TaxID=6500 RepID=A0ABM1A1A7_APLCA|nr:uncharacterized protein LOC106011962 [Aplysia californica]
MTQNKISIMGITDIRKKGTGTKEIHSNVVLIWSGERKDQRAEHSVGFIIHPDKAKEIINTDFISERLIKISIREGKKTTNYIQVYAPCNDSYSDEEKDSFFEQLSDLISSIPDEEDLYVMGDFNGRVEERRTPWTKHLGPHSDHRAQCNYNGNHVLELCSEHDLFKTNTFFQHSLSDLHLVQMEQLQGLITVRLHISEMWNADHNHRLKSHPQYRPDTDQRPIITTLTTKKERKSKNLKRQQERINMHKLGDDQVQAQIRCTLNEKLGSTILTVEEAWDTFKTTLQDTMQEVCGTKKTREKHIKAIAWGNEQV